MKAMRRADIVVSERQGGHIRYTLRRGGVRRVNLRVRADGSVVVSAPTRARLSDVDAFVSSKESWIRMQQGRQSAARDREASRWQDGGKVRFLDEVLTVRLVLDTAATGARRTGDELLLSLPSSDNHTELARDLGRRWLARALSTELPSRFPPFEERLGVACNGWRVRYMRSRWGSCNVRTGVVTINAELASLPSTCLDSVVAHELCHLLEPSHNQRFHELLDSAYPSWREARNILNATLPQG